MSKQDNGTGNVHQLHRDTATRIEPPEGWTAQTKYGTLRNGPGDDDRLVRLVDVLRFLMNDKQIPHDVAVASIADKLQGRDLPVYEVNLGGYADSIDREILPDPDSVWYGLLPTEQSGDIRRTPSGTGVADCIRGKWLVGRRDLELDTSNPAIEKEFHYRPLDEAPFEYFDRVHDYSALYAVSFQVAHELWGWGRIVQAVANDVETPTQETKKVAHYDWKGDPALYAKLVADYGKAEGIQKAKREAVAKEWGLSPATIKKQLPIAMAAVAEAARNPLDAETVARLAGKSSR